MLQKFMVSNYKNFKDAITVNFSEVGGYRFNEECIADECICKMMIYGRNATGKTNLGRAFMDIQTICFGGIIIDDGLFINADSEKKEIEFAYTFLFNDSLLEYSYRRREDIDLLGERLVINGDLIFDIDFLLNKYEFYLERVQAETVITDVYIKTNSEIGEMEDYRRLPFLRWLLANAAFHSSSPLILLNNYVKNMRMQSIRFSLNVMPRRFYESFYDLLSQDDNLKDFESFLNEMGIACALDLQMLPDGKKELYFVHKQPIPFLENASSGTIALMNLYRTFILPAYTASMIYLDEFDAFYHYEMSDKVLQYFKRHFPTCQIIMTTHNTNLMNNRLMRPDCLFILSQDGRLTALCNATERELREGHNLEKMYKSGEFDKYE